MPYADVSESPCQVMAQTGQTWFLGSAVRLLPAGRTRSTHQRGQRPQGITVHGFVPRPLYRDVVTRIYAAYLDAASLCEILRELEAEGVACRSRR